MSDLPIRAVGIAWYRREDYARLRKLFEDGHKLPPTYDQWLQAAEHGKQQLEADGQVVIKVYIDPATFPAWCVARGLNINANARIAYSAEGARDIHGKTH